MTALAGVTLAAAIGCLPGPPTAVRFGTLWPRSGRARRLRPRAAALALIGGVAGLLLLGPAGGLAGAVMVAALQRRRARLGASAVSTASAAQLADALRRMTDELRAGSHPAAVLVAARADGPLVADLLAEAATAAQLGDGVPDALRRAAGERPEIGTDLERVALAWSLAEQHGIALADLLARAQEDIRWRIRYGASVRAQLAGPRATAAVLTALPLLGLGLGQLIGADPIGVLRGGVLGQLLLVIGTTLVLAGAAWSEHILRAAVPR